MRKITTTVDEETFRYFEEKGISFSYALKIFPKLYEYALDIVKVFKRLDRVERMLEKVIEKLNRIEKKLEAESPIEKLKRSLK